MGRAGRPPAEPVDRPAKAPADRPPCCVEPGEWALTSYYGQPYALHVACPRCGARDIVLLTLDPRGPQSFALGGSGQLDTLIPGWKCLWPTCRRFIRVVGGHFRVAEPGAETRP